MERIVPHTSKFMMAFDTFLGAAGITLAVIWPVIETVAQGVALTAGAVLLVLRCLITWREWKNPKD